MASKETYEEYNPANKRKDDYDTKKNNQRFRALVDFPIDPAGTHLLEHLLLAFPG